MRLLAILAIFSAAGVAPPPVTPEPETPLKLACKKNVYAFVYSICLANQRTKKKCRRAARLIACRRKK